MISVSLEKSVAKGHLVRLMHFKAANSSSAFNESIHIRDEIAIVLFRLIAIIEGKMNRRSILDGLGEEIVRIVSLVSICILLVVILVIILNNNSSSSSSITIITTHIYDEQSSDSNWEKFGGALLNALLFVAVVTMVAFLLVCLFYYRCTNFLRFYMGFAAFVVLGYMVGDVAGLLVQALSIPIDSVTFGVVLFNFEFFTFIWLTPLPRTPIDFCCQKLHEIAPVSTCDFKMDFMCRSG